MRISFENISILSINPALAGRNFLFRLALFLPVVLIILIIFTQPASEAGERKKSLRELMNLTLDELAEITVTTPAKMPQKLDEIPATVRVITARTIKERGYITLEDALGDLPGIQFRNILGYNSYVFMRGVANQNNLVLIMIDGVQMNELNSGGFYGGGQYNLANVEKIEVVYGPASAMYGTNAVSGVINIITKNPRDLNGVVYSTTSGGFDTRIYDAVYGFYDKSKDTGVGLSVMYKKSGKADLRGAAGGGNWSDNMDNFEDDRAVDAKIIRGRFTLGLNYQDKYASYASKDKTTGTLFQDYGTNWHINFLNVYAKYDYKKSDSLSWHSLLYYRDTTVLDDTLPLISAASTAGPGYQERWYRPNHLGGIENRLERRIGKKLILTAGSVFEHESLADGFSKSRSVSALTPAAAPSAPAMHGSDLASFYAQLQWLVIGPFSFTAGTRYDKSDVYGRAVTPRLGLVYNRDKYNVKLSYSEAYRAPEVWDYRDGIGNAALTPEEMKSVEFSVNYLFNKRLSSTVSIYKNILDNCLTREISGAGWRWANMGRINTTGFEGGLEYKVNRWKSYLNYTYTDSKSDGGVELAEISPHTANAGIRYSFDKKVSLDLRCQYTGARKNASAPAAPAGGEYVDGAIVVNGDFNVADCKGYDFQLSARNILNKCYYHTSNTSVTMYRQPQFSVMLKASGRF